MRAQGTMMNYREGKIIDTERTQRPAGTMVASGQGRRIDTNPNPIASASAIKFGPAKGRGRFLLHHRNDFTFEIDGAKPKVKLGQQT
jgi:hypothetical protein